jgi:hypothetical protein
VAIARSGSGATGITTATATFAQARPAGAGAGDVGFVHINYGVSSTPTAPTGWTEFGGGQGAGAPFGRWYWRALNGTATDDFSITVASSTGAISYLTYSGANTTNPLDTTPTAVASAAATTHTLASITVVTSGSALVFMGGHASNAVNFTSITGMTEITDVAGRGAATYEQLAAASGATGSKTLTMSTSRAVYYVYFAVEPAAAAAAPDQLRPFIVSQAINRAGAW